MARVSSFLTIVLVTALVSVGKAQQVPATDSVADAAREQKALNRQQTKPVQKKVYTNSDVVQSDATTPTTGTQTSPDFTSSEASAESRVASPNLNSGDKGSSISDRPKPDSPETINRARWYQNHRRHFGGKSTSQCLEGACGKGDQHCAGWFDSSDPELCRRSRFKIRSA